MAKFDDLTEEQKKDAELLVLAVLRTAGLPARYQQASRKFANDLHAWHNSDKSGPIPQETDYVPLGFLPKDLAATLLTDGLEKVTETEIDIQLLENFDKVKLMNAQKASAEENISKLGLKKSELNKSAVADRKK